MASFNKFNSATKGIADKLHNLDTDTLKVFLTNTAPTVTNTQYSQESGNEIANGNGYTTGGQDVGNSTSLTGSTTDVDTTNPTWTSSGAGMATFRYAILYNDTATNKDLIGWWDNGSGITLAVGNQFTLNVASDIILQIA